MNTLKQILRYLIWVFIAMLLAMIHMRIVLGPGPENLDGFNFVLYLFYGYGLLYVGAVIGGIIAVLFILIDVFYLNKRLKNKTNSTMIRLLIIILIAIVVGTTHYLLEKVIDVI